MAAAKKEASAMKFTVSRDVLVKELTALRLVVDTKGTIPSLSYVLIEARDGDLHLTATDLEVSLKTQCQVEDTQPGSIAVPCKRLLDIAKSLANEPVHCHLEAHERLYIRCGAAHFRLAGVAIEHFPSVPDSLPVQLSLPAASLTRLISHIAYAITPEESRYALSGALLLYDNGRLQMVATDGHRLSMASVETEQATVRVLIPQKTLTVLSTLLGDGDVQFSFDENHAFFQFGGERELSTRLLAGQFPTYQQIIPKNSPNKLELSAAGLRTSLKRVLLMADARSHSVRFKLTAGNLMLTARGAETDEAVNVTSMGEATDTLPVEYAGSPIEIGFNGKYITDFLSAIQAERVLIELKDAESPALFIPVGEVPEQKYVIMPMRLL